MVRSAYVLNFIIHELTEKNVLHFSFWFSVKKCVQKFCLIFKLKIQDKTSIWVSIAQTDIAIVSFDSF